MIDAIYEQTGQSLRLIHETLGLPRSSYYHASKLTHQPRTFVPKTCDGRVAVPSPNLLIERAAPIKPNEVQVSDCTYIACGSGFIYLYLVMDLCSRRVVGWSLADHMRTDLVTDALHCATQAQPPTKGLIFHGDRGRQQASKALRK
jgi:transposase InsO family protein